LTVDYLIIGNVTQDLLPDGGHTVGGTVTYAARTALAFGCRVGVVTSAAPGLDLSSVLAGAEVALLPAEETMTFENVYAPAGRVQFLHARAAPLDLEAVPRDWRQPAIVHLAPLAGECDPALVDAFPEAFVGVTPQGWMRAWDDSGRVYVSEWSGAAGVLPWVDAAVMSLHDAASDESTITRFAQLAPVVAVTLGPEGCRVYARGEERHVPVTPLPEVDPTGAGDIFAAAFFVCLRQSGDPWSAADFANRVASLSVQRAGWAGTPTPEEIASVQRSASPTSVPCGGVKPS
jgi:sugar/nucleoside kinase (ribokinase family)